MRLGNFVFILVDHIQRRTGSGKGIIRDITNKQDLGHFFEPFENWRQRFLHVRGSIGRCLGIVFLAFFLSVLGDLGSV